MGAKSHAGLDFGDTSPETSLMHSGAAATAEKTPHNVEQPKPDFSGWATKANLKCADGRTILPGAFAHQDQVKVPLVWQHGHSEPSNVLGHTILFNRDEGVYCHGFFNETEQGKNSKIMVEHQDIDSLSIFANQLVERAKQVSHGIIREVSLVLSRANPGALIDNLELQHGDSGEYVTIEDEAVIYTGEKLVHGDEPSKPEDDEGDGPTVQEVYDGMSSDQKEVVHHFVEAAIEQSKEEPEGDPEDGKTAITHGATGADDKEGTRVMKRNVFEQQNGGTGGADDKPTLSHDDLAGIVADGISQGSLRKGFEAYALKHGIDNIDVLFPDARTVTETPEFDKRRTEWVSSVINGVSGKPFARIKSIVADITVEEARARGYIKGTLKKEEFFGLAKRITTPTTIYKKQQLDRDDIIDITDLDVVAWLKGEMRLMLDEEIARAILVSDGRAVDDPDKVKDPAGANEAAGIRSILNDHDLYAATVNVAWDDADMKPGDITDQIVGSMRFYKGSGSPTMYTTQPMLTKMLLVRDTMGRRLYRTAAELASELGVSNIVPVEVMENEAYDGLVGIIVNLSDYAVGTDRGGDVTMFDDFDIDYNQYKYLIEGRMSGALTKIRSALVVKRVDSADILVDAPAPDFDPATGDITVPTDANVNYFRADTDAAVADGATVNVPAGQSLTIYATPSAGHYFSTNVEDQWTFTNRP